MKDPRDPRKKEQSGTYVMQDQQNEEDLIRLTLQAQLFTASMGGPLSEQPDPTIFSRILDVGCGSGSWVIEAAEMYPTLSLVGIDISPRMVSYARKQADAHGVSDRVEFFVMDALRMLEFPAEFFDMVNLRLGFSFMRTWDWPKMLHEMLRVTRPNGSVQVTDSEISHQSSSPALAQLTEMSLCAFFQAGHLFTQESTGLTAHLPRLLVQHGYQQVQSKAYSLNYQPGTSELQMFYEDMKHLFHLIRPFFQKWGCASDDYDAIYQQALKEMQDPAFHATWNLLSVWGTKPSYTSK